jgi:hypothetical protein
VGACAEPTKRCEVRKVEMAFGSVDQPDSYSSTSCRAATHCADEKWESAMPRSKKVLIADREITSAVEAQLPLRPSR